MDYRPEDTAFAIEANDLLREVWNQDLFKDNPILKARLAKLLEIPLTQKIV